MRYVTAVRALDTFVTTRLQKAVGGGAGGGGKWCFGTLCTFFGFGFFYFPSVVVLSFYFLWEHYRAVAL